MKKKILLTIVALILILGLLIFINPGQIVTLTFLRLLGQYKTPGIENPESIKEYVQDHQVYYDKLYAVRNIKSFRELGQTGVNAIPAVQIFNKDKLLLKMATDKSCSWALTDFFIKGQGENMVVKDSSTYSYVMDRLTPIDLKTETDTFNFYIINYWAKYTPKLTNRLFVETNSMREKMSANVCYIYVTLDEQENWE
jgi:hypothetical protein